MARAQLHRSFYDLITGSVPLFLTIGNHEGEWGTNLNGTPQDYAIWDTQYRNMYFPDPAPDSFFSGDSQQYDLDGNLCTPSQTLPADWGCGETITPGPGAMPCLSCSIPSGTRRRMPVRHPWGTDRTAVKREPRRQYLRRAYRRIGR